MKPHIAVVGSINMDLVFQTPRMPLPGETLMGHRFHLVHGGKGANQAVAAARMGAAVHMIACVGDDANGHSCLQTLQADAIDTAHVRVVPDCATGVAGILLDDAGQNSIVLATGANASLVESDIDAARSTIAQAKLLLCQLETPLSTVLHAIQYAKQVSVAAQETGQEPVKVVLNPAPAQKLDAQVLKQVDYLVVNETEASLLSDVSVTDLPSAQAAATVLQQLGAGVVIVTLGAMGIWVADADQAYSLPAFQVKVVDTTAAGDTFVGSLAVAIAEGMDLRAACMFAQSAAALAVTQLGAQTSIPYRGAVERQLQSL